MGVKTLIYVKSHRLKHGVTKSEENLSEVDACILDVEFRIGEGRGALEEDWDEGGWGGGITVEDQLVEEVGIFGDVGELFNP